VPGSPVEGWAISWKTTPSGSDTIRVMKGLVRNDDFTSKNIDCYKTGTTGIVTWEGTSDGTLSLQQTTVIEFDKLYFTTTITLRNMASAPLYDVHYLRTVDPDQEQPWTGQFSTLNFVRFQPFRTGDPAGYVHPDEPDTSLVMAVGRTHSALVCGLGTVHPNARASHFGFNNNVPQAAWTNTAWTSHSNTSPRSADEAINLDFKFPRIDAGATATFSWAYVLGEDDLQEAMGRITQIAILQPSSEASGEILFSAAVVNTVATVTFVVEGLDGTTKFTQALVRSDLNYVQPNGMFVYSVPINTKSAITSGAAQFVFRVSATTDDGENLQSNSLVNVDNEGPELEWITPTATDGSAKFKNFEDTTVTVRQIADGTFTISRVEFFREVTGSSTNIGLGVKSGTGASATWSIDLDASDMAVQSPVAVKAVAYSTTGKKGTTVVTGKVSELNFAPDDVTLSALLIEENKPANSLIGSLTASDPNTFDSHTFSIVSGSALIKLDASNNALLLSKVLLDHESTPTTAFTVRATDSGGLTFDKSFSIVVANVNDPPSDIVVPSGTITENAPVGTIIGALSAVDQDAADSHTFAVVGGGGILAVAPGTSQLRVASPPNFEALVGGIFSVTLQTQDSLGAFVSKTVSFNVADVNEAPSALTVTVQSPSEDDPAGTTVAQLAVTDQDSSSSYTFTYTVSPVDHFSVVAGSDGVSADLRTSTALNFESVQFYDVLVTATDGTAPFHVISKSFRVNVQDVFEPPSFTQAAYYCSVQENAAAESLVCSVGASHSKASLELEYAVMSGNEGGKFFLHPCSGNLFVADAAPGLNFEMAASYQLQVNVTGEGLSAFTTIYVSVTDLNEPPQLQVVDASVSELAPIGTQVWAPLSVNDEDAGDSHSFTISPAATAAGFSINTNTGALSISGALNYEAQASVSVLVTVRDSGDLMDTATATVTIVDENEPPVVYAQNAVVQENLPAGQLIGLPVQAVDPDARQSTVLAVVGDAAAMFELDNSTLQLKTKQSFNYEGVSSYEVTLSAVDNGPGALVGTATVTVRVLDVNDAPTLSSATLSVDENLPRGTQIGSIAGGSFDEDGDSLVFSLDGAACTDNLGNSATPPAVSAAGNVSVGRFTELNFEQFVQMSCAVKVVDLWGAVATASLNIDIHDVNEAPTVRGLETGTVPENSATGTAVCSRQKESPGFTGSNSCILNVYDVNDEDNDELSVYIEDPLDAFVATMEHIAQGALRIHVNTSRMSVMDYETFPDDYFVILTAGDGEFNSTFKLEVSIEDLNELPVLHDWSTFQAEKSQVQHLLSLTDRWTDPDTTTAFRPSFTSGEHTFNMVWESPSGFLQLDQATGALFIKSDKVPSATVNNIAGLMLNASVTISDGALVSAPANITIHITDVNQAPAITSGTISSPPEHAAAGVQVCTLTVTDNDGGDSHVWSIETSPDSQDAMSAPYFRVDPLPEGSNTMQLVTTGLGELDFERKTSHTIVVTVIDSGSPSLSASMAVTVPVADLPEKPVWQLNSLPPATAFDIHEMPAVGDAVQVTSTAGYPAIVATDPDGDGIMYSLVGSSSPFNLVNEFRGFPNATAGFVAKDTSIDFETLREAQCASSAPGCKPHITMAVRATDSSESALFVDTTVSVSVSDVNERPMLSLKDTSSLSEDAPLGTTLPCPVIATDPDDTSAFTSTLTYTVVSEYFSVDASSGELTLIRALDWETVQQVGGSVTVSDAGSFFDSAPARHLSATAAFSVAVANVNDLTVSAAQTLLPFTTAGNAAPSLQVTGSNFGLSPAAGPGRAALPASFKLVSDEREIPLTGCTVSGGNRLQCAMPPGVGSGFHVQLQFGDDSASTRTFVSYPPPTITNIGTPTGGSRLLTAQTWSTQGGEVFTVSGSNLPSASALTAEPSLLVIMYGPPPTPQKYTAVQCTMTLDYEQATCKTAPGVGPTLVFAAHVAGQPSAVFTGTAVRFSAPSVHRVIMPRAALPTVATGSEQIIIQGANFGPPSELSLVHLELRSTRPNSTFAVQVPACVPTSSNHSELTCPAPSGVGQDLVPHLTVAAQPSTVTIAGSLVSYELPAVTRVIGPGSNRASTAGGEQVTVIGRNFGVPIISNTAFLQVMYGAAAEMAFQATECVVLSDTRMSCLTGPGTGEGHSWQVHLEGGESTTSFIGTSYQWPSVTTFDGLGADLASTEGGQVVDISGINFGTAQRSAVDYVTYERNGTLYTAVGCAVVDDHVLIRCFTAPGTGKGLSWTVYVDGQQSRSPTTNYAPPSISGYSPATDLPVAGGAEVWIMGSNFGHPASSALLQSVTHGPVSGAEFDLTPACSLVNDTAIQCVSQPTISGDHRVVVTVADQRNDVSPALMFAAPTLASLHVASGEQLLRGDRWDAALAAPLTTAPTHATVSGQPSALPMIVRAVGSNFAQPTREALVFLEVFGPYDGETFLSVPSVEGDQTYSFGSSSSSNVGGTDSIEFVLPVGVGIADRQVRLGVAFIGSDPRTASSLTAARRAAASYSNAMPFFYQVPSLSFVAFENRAAACAENSGFSYSVTLFGDSFGQRLQDVQVHIQPSSRAVYATCASAMTPATPQGSHKCTHVSFVQDHFVLKCLTNVNEGFISVVAVDQDSTGTMVNASTQSVYFRQANPSISALACQGCIGGAYPTAGGAVLQISGAYLAAPDSNENVTVTVDGQDCPVVNATLSTLYCIVPPGQGHDHVPVVRIGSQVSNAGSGIRISYMKPEVMSVEVVSALSGELRYVNITAQPAATIDVKCGNPWVQSMAMAQLYSAGSTVLLRGHNFGRQPSVSIGLLQMARAYGVNNIRVNAEHTQLSFDIPQGFGSGLKHPLACSHGRVSGSDVISGVLGWQLVVSDSSRALEFAVDTEWVNYGTPVLVRFDPPALSAVQPSLVRTKGEMIELTGSSLGCVAAACGPTYLLARDMAPAVLLGRGSSVVPCAVTEYSPQTIKCAMPSGVGGGWSVEVQVDGQSALEGSFVGYLPPTVMAVTPDTVQTSGLALDGVTRELVIGGSNFGAQLGQVYFMDESLSSPSLAFEAGQRVDQTFAVQAWDHSSITVHAPSSGGKPFCVVVVAGSQDNLVQQPVMLSFADPHVHSVAHGSRSEAECTARLKTISLNPIYAAYFPNISASDTLTRIDPADCFPTAGNFPVRIQGSSFGSPADRSTLDVLIEGERCVVEADNPQVHGHDFIVCTAPMGIGLAHLQVTRSSRYSNSTLHERRSSIHDNSTLQYDAPVVSSFMPNAPSANGDRMVISGKNFGTARTTVNVSLGAQPCARSDWLNDGAAECLSRAAVAGPKNVSVQVTGSKAVFMHDWEMRVVYTCEKNEYGLWGEECLQCPVGAVCPGAESTLDLTYSDIGFFKQDLSTPTQKCPAERWTRGVCPYFAPCEPSWACAGNNTCAVGYEGDRCARCVKGEYYRIGGLCQKCPDQQWLLLVGLAVAMVSVLGAGYYLHKRKLRLGVFTVVVDFFQVVAMFARTRVEWPPAIVAIFNALSAFSLNVEITAPECAVPNVTVEQKLNLVLALPLIITGLIFVGGVCSGVWTMLMQGAVRTKTMQSSIMSCIGPLITLLYFMYLLVARQALDVFNCSPTVPPDGNLYMSGMTEIVCWSDTHNRLLPLAATAICVYVIGFPVWVTWQLRRSRDTIRVAQLARAQKTPVHHMLDKVSTFDARYSRLFWLFKPFTASFYIVVILTRKFGIAFAALMFRTTPTFMMAVCLLVLFASFAMQTKFEPYMGVSDYPQVCQEFDLSLNVKSPMALRLKAMLDSSKQTKQGKNVGFASKNRGFGRVSRGGSQMKQLAFQNKGESAELSSAFKAVMSLNLIESVLLGAAILINLLGLMFLSARFEGDQKQYYETEYNILAYTTMTVLIVSILFAVFMLVLDILSVLAPSMANRLAHLVACSAVRKAASRRAAGRDSMGLARSSSVGLQVNPMTQGKGRAQVSLEYLLSSKEKLIKQLETAEYPNEEQYKILVDAALTHLHQAGSIRARDVSFAKPTLGSIVGGRKRQEFTQEPARANAVSQQEA